MRRLVSLALVSILLAASACAVAPEVKPLLWKDVRYPFPEHVARIAGHDVVYVDEGPREDPEPIVFIHGLGGDLRNWSENIGVFARVKRVVAPDLPGFGKSEKKAEGDYRPTVQADAVVQLLDHLGAARATLVGNSMGGQIAAWAALRHPERVARLVLVDAAGLRETNWFADWLFSEERVRDNDWRDPASAEGWVFEKTPAGWVEEVETLYFVSRTDPQWATYAKTFRSAFAGIGAELVTDRLGEIRAPTLVVWGDKDGLVPLECAYEFHYGIRGSLLAVFRDTGHVPQWERPESFNAALATFLGVSLAPRPSS